MTPYSAESLNLRREDHAHLCNRLVKRGTGLFEYVATDVYGRNIADAIEVARARVVNAGLIVDHVKRVTENRKGRSTTFTIVLMVRNV